MTSDDGGVHGIEGGAGRGAAAKTVDGGTDGGDENERRRKMAAVAARPQPVSMAHPPPNGRWPRTNPMNVAVVSNGPGVI